MVTERTKLVYSTASRYFKDETRPHHVPVGGRPLCRCWRFEDSFSTKWEQEYKVSGYPACRRLPVYGQRRYECDRQHAVRVRICIILTYV